jgi:hypothetical protein
VSRIAQGRDGCSATLMKTISARPTIEALKQQASAGLAVSQRKECFAHLFKSSFKLTIEM